jgi:NAD(P)-dependent dehydrogenase (short-subunit alcohol dehydrogenase family)
VSSIQRGDSAIPNLFDLSTKRALITGAGGGLGRVFAQVLARFGAEVICADRDMDRAAQTASIISAAGGRSRSVGVDVADANSVNAMMLVLEMDRIDILINNAGIASAPQRLHELSISDWNTVIAVNLNGTFLCTRAVLPRMLSQGGGSIINLSSILGLDGFYPTFAATAGSYGASKAAVIGLTRQVAMEYARDNIRVNAIAPGWHVGTDLGRERRATATPEENAIFEEAILRESPMGRFGQPEELEGLVVYLASDASRFVTGQVFAHDGGWSSR